MIKISDAISEIIEKNPILTFAFHHKLLNLTRTAEFLKPLIEARTKKEVRTSAILMNLSRHQKRYEKMALNNENFSVKDISVTADMSTITYPLTDEVIPVINRLYGEIHKKGGRMVITRGTREITIIVNSGFLPLIEKNAGTKFRYKKSNIAAIDIVFDEKYSEIPGLLYALLQQIRLQNINIVEIISTYTELILYVEKDKAKLSFDTIFQSFAG